MLTSADFETSHISIQKCKVLVLGYNHAKFQYSITYQSNVTRGWEWGQYVPLPRGEGIAVWNSSWGNCVNICKYDSDPTNKSGHH